MAKPAYEIKQLEPSNFDSRLVERHLGEGRLNAKELQKHLDGLMTSPTRARSSKSCSGTTPRPSLRASSPTPS